MPPSRGVWTNAVRARADFRRAIELEPRNARAHNSLGRALAQLKQSEAAVESFRQAIVLERFYAGLVAKGFGIWIGTQAFINMGVNLGLLPTKGLTLPLMSYGGSGILVNCLAIAIVMRVDYENRILMRGGRR